jgi:hypothetical protein
MRIGKLRRQRRQSPDTVCGTDIRVTIGRSGGWSLNPRFCRMFVCLVRSRVMWFSDTLPNRLSISEAVGFFVDWKLEGRIRRQIDDSKRTSIVAHHYRGSIDDRRLGLPTEICNNRHMQYERKDERSPGRSHRNLWLAKHRAPSEAPRSWIASLLCSIVAYF